MITHERLMETVAARARLGGADEAAHVTRTVLADLSLRLDAPERRRLRQSLPAADRDAAFATVPARGGEATDFLRDIGEHLHIPPERARYLAAAVLSTLRTSEPGLAEDLAWHLPPGFSELFAAPPAAEPAASLTASDLRRELRARPAWSGSPLRLERAVSLPSDRIGPLLHRVALATRGLPGRVRHRVGAGEVTFVLSTRAAGAVTEADLRLADAVDAVVDDFGSSG